MLRFVIFSLVSSAIIISCMGQTFQYSRGWTNGKRAFSHVHEDPAMTEVFEIPTESERLLEKCIIQLQRFMHNPYLMRPSYTTIGNNNPFANANGGGGSIRHQANEIFENSASEPVELSTKHK